MFLFPGNLTTMLIHLRQILCFCYPHIIQEFYINLSGYFQLNRYTRILYKHVRFGILWFHISSKLLGNTSFLNKYCFLSVVHPFSFSSICLFTFIFMALVGSLLDAP